MHDIKDQQLMEVTQRVLKAITNTIPVKEPIVPEDLKDKPDEPTVGARGAFFIPKKPHPSKFWGKGKNHRGFYLVSIASIGGKLPRFRDKDPLNCKHHISFVYRPGKDDP